MLFVDTNVITSVKHELCIFVYEFYQEKFISEALLYFYLFLKYILQLATDDLDCPPNQITS